MKLLVFALQNAWLKLQNAILMEIYAFQLNCIDKLRKEP